MTEKEKVLALFERMPDDIPMYLVRYRLDLLKAVEEGLEDIRQGRWVDHDELFDELLKDDEASQDNLGRKRSGRSGRNPAAHRKASAKNGRTVRKATKRSRK